MIQKYDDSALNVKLKEKEDKLKELNGEVKYQVQFLLEEKKTLLKSSLIQFVKQNIENEEQTIVLWKELQTKMANAHRVAEIDI